jgi:hypothetical protein
MSLGESLEFYLEVSTSPENDVEKEKDVVCKVNATIGIRTNKLIW